MYFTFNFFDFPNLRTDNVCFNLPDEEQNEMFRTNMGEESLIFVRENWVKTGISQKELQFRFDFDPVKHPRFKKLPALQKKYKQQFV